MTISVKQDQEAGGRRQVQAPHLQVGKGGLPPHGAKGAIGGVS